MAARVAGSALQLAILLTLTRTLTPAVAAEAIVIGAWAQALSALIAWGRPLLIMREVSRHDVEGIPTTLRPHFKATLTVGAGVTSVFLLAAPLVGGPWAALLTGAAATMQACTRLATHALKARRKEVSATLLEFALWPTLLALSLLLATATDISVNATVFAGVQAAAMTAAAIFSLMAWLRTRGPLTKATTRPGSTQGIHYLGASSTLAIVSAHAPVMVAPLMLDSSSMVAFSVAFRVTGLATTILNALASYYAPRIARAAARRDSAAIARALTSSQLTGAALGLPLLAAIPFSHVVLGAFGAPGVDAAAPFAILAVAQFVNVAAGVASYALNMAGRERWALWLRASSLVAMGLGWILLALAGDVDATSYAWPYAISLIAMNVLGAGLARRRDLLSTLTTRTPVNSEKTGAT